MKKLLSRALHFLENSIDTIKNKYIWKHNKRGSVLIEPYIGYGTESCFYITGRVLKDKGIIKAKYTDSVWKNLKAMYKRFESDEIPGVEVCAIFQDVRQCAFTNEEGYFHITLNPKDSLPDRALWHDVRLILRDRPVKYEKTIESEAQILVPCPNAQYGIISDIDDTIMKTDVSNLTKMLRQTLLNNSATRIPFNGVAFFYRQLVKGPGDSFENPIFYISKSPWNLYGMLIDFMELHQIPKGPLLLRDWGVDEKLYMDSAADHKLDSINKIFETYLHLNFILIGDNSEKDPEIYEQVANKNPGRVLAIYIRDVTGSSSTLKLREIKTRLANKGLDMILMKDTSEAQAHALTKNFIKLSSAEREKVN